MSSSIILPARLDLSEAQSLHKEMTKLDMSSEIVCNAAAVTHVGAICVQTLIAAARSALDAGGKLTLENVSERVEKQLAAMGLSSQAVMEGAR